MNAWSVLAKDLCRYARDPTALAVWAGVPLAIGLLVTAATEGLETDRARAIVWWVDCDQTVVSQRLPDALKGMGAPLEFRSVVDEAEARRRLESGDGSALLVVPEGFGRDVFRAEPLELTLWVNPTHQVLPTLVRESVELLAQAVDVVHRWNRARPIPAPWAAVDPSSEPWRATQSLLVLRGELAEFVEQASSRMSVTPDSGFEARASEPFALLLLPGLLFIAVFFIAQGIGEDLWTEREQGTLARAMATPMGLHGLLFGKMLAAIVLIALVSTLVLVVGLTHFGQSLARVPAAIAWVAASGGVLALMLAWAQTFASSRRSANVLAHSFVLPLLMLGGSFCPLELMPDWMATVGRLTPNGWAASALSDLLFARATTAKLVVHVAMLGAGCTVFGGLAVGRMRRWMAFG